MKRRMIPKNEIMTYHHHQIYRENYQLYPNELREMKPMIVKLIFQVRDIINQRMEVISQRLFQQNIHQLKVDEELFELIMMMMIQVIVFFYFQQKKSFLFFLGVERSSSEKSFDSHKSKSPTSLSFSKVFVTSVSQVQSTNDELKQPLTPSTSDSLLLRSPRSILKKSNPKNPLLHRVPKPIPRTSIKQDESLF